MTLTGRDDVVFPPLVAVVGKMIDESERRNLPKIRGGGGLGTFEDALNLRRCPQFFASKTSQFRGIFERGPRGDPSEFP
jgi:hypothetical protein